jgi:hypothetical protein
VRYDLLRSLEAALRRHGLRPSRAGGWLVVEEFYLRPQMVEIEPLGPNGVRTTTTIAIAHERLAPGGLFESQHALGDDVEVGLANRFAQWIQLDLPVLRDAPRDRPESCVVMEIESWGPEVRRVLLGPVIQTTEREPTEPEEHPFCSCSKFTHSLQAPVAR